MTLLQYRTVQYWYDTVRYGTVRYGIVDKGVAYRYGTVLYDINGISFSHLGIPLVYRMVNHKPFVYLMNNTYQNVRTIKYEHIGDVANYYESTVRVKSRIVHVNRVRACMHAYTIYVNRTQWATGHIKNNATTTYANAFSNYTYFVFRRSMQLVKFRGAANALLLLPLKSIFVGPSAVLRFLGLLLVSYKLFGFRRVTFAVFPKSMRFSTGVCCCYR
jgi:hypothetical protein